MDQYTLLLIVPHHPGSLIKLHLLYLKLLLMLMFPKIPNSAMTGQLLLIFLMKMVSSLHSMTMLVMLVECGFALNQMNVTLISHLQLPIALIFGNLHALNHSKYLLMLSMKLTPYSTDGKVASTTCQESTFGMMVTIGNVNLRLLNL